jgi:hypothetical protein
MLFYPAALYHLEGPITVKTLQDKTAFFIRFSKQNDSASQPDIIKRIRLL